MYLCTSTNNCVTICSNSWVGHVLQVFATSLCENAPILLNSAPVLEEKLVRSEEFLSIGTCTFRIEYYSGFSPSPLREGNLLTTPREVHGWDKDQLCMCVLHVCCSITVCVLFCYRKLWSLPKLQRHPPLPRRARKTWQPLLRYRFYSRSVLAIIVTLVPKWGWGYSVWEITDSH